MVEFIQGRRELISIYFCLAKINFTDDVLDELCIDKKYRITKPGKVPYPKDIIYECFGNHRERNNDAVFKNEQHKKARLKKHKIVTYSHALNSKSHNKYISNKSHFIL